MDQSIAPYGMSPSLCVFLTTGISSGPRSTPRRCREGKVSGSGEDLLPLPAYHHPHGPAKRCEDPLCTQALSWTG